MSLRALIALAGCLVVIGAAFLPAHAYRVGTPGLHAQLQPGPKRVVLLPIGEPAVAPYGDFAEGLSAWCSGASAADAIWPRRVNYPYLLAPLWLLALLISRGRRHAVGWWLLALTALLIWLEGAYLLSDYQPMLLQGSGRTEAWIAWCIVTLVLLARPRGAWHPTAAGAAIGAQAALCVLHMLTLPTTMVRDWIGVHSLSDILSAIAANFGPGYWWALIGFAVVVGTAWWPRRRPLDVPENDPSSAEATAPPVLGTELPSAPR